MNDEGLDARQAAFKERAWERLRQTAADSDACVPSGWRVVVRERKSTSNQLDTEGRPTLDAFYYDPAGRRYRSPKEACAAIVELKRGAAGRPAAKRMKVEPKASGHLGVKGEPGGVFGSLLAICAANDATAPTSHCVHGGLPPQEPGLEEEDNNGWHQLAVLNPRENTAGQRSSLRLSSQPRRVSAAGANTGGWSRQGAKADAPSSSMHAAGPDNGPTLHAPPRRPCRSRGAWANLVASGFMWAPAQASSCNVLEAMDGPSALHRPSAQRSGRAPCLAQAQPQGHSSGDGAGRGPLASQGAAGLHMLADLIALHDDPLQDEADTAAAAAAGAADCQTAAPAGRTCMHTGLLSVMPTAPPQQQQQQQQQRPCSGGNCWDMAVGGRRHGGGGAPAAHTAPCQANAGATAGSGRRAAAQPRTDSDGATGAGDWSTPLVGSTFLDPSLGVLAPLTGVDPAAAKQSSALAPTVANTPSPLLTTGGTPGVGTAPFLPHTLHEAGPASSGRGRAASGQPWPAAAAAPHADGCGVTAGDPSALPLSLMVQVANLAAPQPAADAPDGSAEPLTLPLLHSASDGCGDPSQHRALRLLQAAVPSLHEVLGVVNTLRSAGIDGAAFIGFAEACGMVHAALCCLRSSGGSSASDCVLGSADGPGMADLVRD